MSEYYLPVKIAKRRIHICKLNSEENKNNFEYIVPVDGDKIELFSIPPDGVLISDSGTAHDKAVLTQAYLINGVISEQDASEIKIDILLGKTNEKKDKPYTQNNLHIKRDDDTDIFIAKTTNQLKLKRLNFTITYLDEEDQAF